MEAPLVNQNVVTSLYIHFPYCNHLCNYCDFYKLKLDDQKRQLNFSEFGNYLENSWDHLTRLLSSENMRVGPLETIYFGGGTPSLWGEDGIRFIQQFFDKNNFQLSKDCEWAIEVSPGTTSKKELQDWKSLGVNRFSIGTQTLNEKLFPLVDRNYAFEQALDLLKIMSELNVNFSADFMLGLPESEKWGRSLDEELKTILDFGAKHLSLYFLTVPKHYKHFHLLPSDQWTVNEYLKVCEILGQQGFEHYEVASFAKTGHKSRHNQRYWDHESVLALGPSGVGFLNSEKLKRRFRWSTNWLNKKNPKLDVENLTTYEVDLERVYLTLRKGRAFCLEDLMPYQEFSTKVKDVLSSWNAEGFLTKIAVERFQMTPKGWLVLDSLVQQILTFLKPTSS